MDVKLICARCDGRGGIDPMREAGPGIFECPAGMPDIPCHECGGTGLLGDRRPCYIQVADGPVAKTIEAEGLVVDYTPEGKVRGIEVLK